MTPRRTFRVVQGHDGWGRITVSTYQPSVDVFKILTWLKTSTGAEWRFFGVAQDVACFATQTPLQSVEIPADLLGEKV